MTELMQASNQWMSRPADERFTCLPSMLTYLQGVRARSRATTAHTKAITFQPVGDDHKSLAVVGSNCHPYAPTNWAFDQLCQLAGAPAAYLRTLPTEIVADNLNYSLRYNRETEDVGLLLSKVNNVAELRAATGPNYGRIWNADVVDALIKKFGDGVTGDWRVPGEFGKAVTVNKSNTTLYASDRDMFVFLADEVNRVTVPNRRNGQPGSLARGFFTWNSEVGKSTIGLGTFLFDYVCMNRIVWGATEYKEVRIRHTVSAPHRWLEKVQPVLLAYANASAKPVEAMLAATQAKKVDDVNGFLRERFGRGMVDKLGATHMAEEGRPIETLWDVSTAVTAYARGLPHQDVRVELERQAGEVLKLAA